MTSEDRKKHILATLEQSDKAVSATAFAKQLSVSRQIIVGDIALLRASGSNITATPRGYILESPELNSYTVVCKHGGDNLIDELYAVVDCGCGLIDVIIEHPIYGQIVGNLHIFSRNDADEFVRKMEENNTAPLCNVTNQIHLHSLSCPSDKHFEQVKESLRTKGFLIEKD